MIALNAIWVSHGDIMLNYFLFIWELLHKIHECHGLHHPCGIISLKGGANVDIKMHISTYEDDCECLEICKKLGGTYAQCYKDENMIILKRCSVETRKLLLQKHSQEPSRLSKTISRIERISLWLIALGGLIIALIALLCG